MSLQVKPLSSPEKYDKVSPPNSLDNPYPLSMKKTQKATTSKGLRLSTKLFSRLQISSLSEAPNIKPHPKPKKRKLDKPKNVETEEKKRRKKCQDFGLPTNTRLQKRKNKRSRSNNDKETEDLLALHWLSLSSERSLGTQTHSTTTEDKHKSMIKSHLTSDRKGKGRMRWFKEKPDDWYKLGQEIRGCSSTDISYSQVAHKLRELGAQKNIKFYSVGEIPVNKGNTVNIFYDDPAISMDSILVELVCLISLKGAKRIAKVISVLEDEWGHLIGLTMVRYQMTLEEYLQVERRVTARQKYKLIKDMVAAVKVLHDQGIAHCSLSDANFMVNEVDGILLKDYSPRPRATLVNYKKARFIRNDLSLDEQFLFRKSHLPDPDQAPTGSSKDNSTAEDINSLGRLIWYAMKLQKPGGNPESSQITEDSYRLRTEIYWAFPGIKCRELLVGCLLTEGTGRWNINRLSQFICSKRNRSQLIMELDGEF